MNPVIQYLQDTFFSEHALGVSDPDPLKWTFSECINALDPEFYKKLVPSHMILNIQHSLLGQQNRADLLSTQPVDEEQLVHRLVASLLVSELLERVYRYLDVPREIKRFRAQQKIYRDLLREIKGAVPKYVPCEEKVSVGFSLSQKVRMYTIEVNLYRLLFIRTKRVLDLAAALETTAEWYRRIIGNVDKYMDPVLIYISWFFYIPRLITNLFLLFKHLIPGSWMDEEEEKLGLWIRFQAQMLRRWFELANDVIWVTVGIISFILVGLMIAYLNLGFLGADVFLAAMRAGIEVGRLFVLRKQYQQELNVHPENQKEIERILQVLEKQINFELLRFGSHVFTTTWVFLATFCIAPLFFGTLVPFVGALLLLAISLFNFAVAAIIDYCRPKDTIEIPSAGIKNLGFFAQKNEPKGKKEKSFMEDPMEDVNLPSIPCSI
jgi:hypothetical protein